MKILIVSPWYKPHIGGVVKTITKLIDGLHTAGADVTLLLGGDSYKVRQEGEDGRTAIFSCRMRTPQTDHSQVRAFIAWLIFLPFTLLNLRRFLLEQQIDIVNIHFPNAQYVYFALLMHLLPVKVVVSTHGSDMGKLYAMHNVNKVLTRYLLRRSDVLVACSENLLRHTLELIGGKSRGHSHVIHGGVEADWLETSDLEAFENNGPYLLSVGSLRPVKGFDILIRALGQLKDLESNIKLRIAGDGPMREELEQLTEELGLNGRVEFEGSLSHEFLRPLYCGATLCVVPSREEALSLAALEAQATGLAVIASEVGGLPEIIDDGINGLLCPVGDVSALSQAIAQLLNDPSRRREMGQIGRKRIREKFTWDLNHRKYLNIFSTLISSRP